jgi:hypothetical protein
VHRNLCTVRKFNNRLKNRNPTALDDYYGSLLDGIDSTERTFAILDIVTNPGRDELITEGELGRFCA